MNAVERELVETRVLNPTASEASYKPKQRSYRTTNLKKQVRRRNGGAESAAPKRTRPHSEIPHTSQYYGIEGFKGGSQLVPNYAERH